MVLNTLGLHNINNLCTLYNLCILCIFSHVFFIFPMITSHCTVKKAEIYHIRSSEWDVHQQSVFGCEWSSVLVSDLGVTVFQTVGGLSQCCLAYCKWAVWWHRCSNSFFWQLYCAVHFCSSACSCILKQPEHVWAGETAFQLCSTADFPFAFAENLSIKPSIL